MRKKKEYFSQTYEEARTKFLEATKKLISETAKIRDDLYIDFAYTKKKNQKVLIIISGTHGVEAYLGSVAQILFIEEYLPRIKNFDVCLVHALNPYGFKNDRRVNENNVDLNRNAIYDERLMLGVPNTFLSNILSESLLYLKLNKPRKHRIIEQAKYYALVIKTVVKQGIKNTIRIGIGGQSEHPYGVGFKGIKLEDSLLYLRSFIEQRTKGYEEAILIDLHSGIGRKYDLLGFTNQPKNTEDFIKLKKILKKVRSRANIKLINHSGSVSDLFLARSQAKKNVDLTLEYGTIPKISSKLVFEYLGRLNIEENQVFYFGNDKKREKTRKKYKKAYSPTDAVFKKSLIRKTKKFYEKLLREYEE